MAFFVVRITYHPEFEQERLAARPRHREWLRSLKKNGRLHNAGPLADGSGAIVVFLAKDLAELELTMAEDPYPTHTFSSKLLGEWQPLFDN